MDALLVTKTKRDRWNPRDLRGTQALGIDDAFADQDLIHIPKLDRLMSSKYSSTASEGCGIASSTVSPKLETHVQALCHVIRWFLVMQY